jgi:hypothetical protein
VEHVFAVVSDPAEPVHLGPLDRDGSAAWFGVGNLPGDVAPGVTLHVAAALRALDAG